MKFYPHLILLVAILLIVAHSQAQSLDSEQQVRAALQLFQQGVETGDKALGAQLATPEFAGTFLALYSLLADAYSQAQISFPMAIEHLKILSNGKAKAEVYLNPGRDRFIFTLVQTEQGWKICHLENILFPIYAVPAMPYDSILMVPRQQAGWMLAERDLAFKSRLYNHLKQQNGELAAQHFFLDGPGYKAAMDAWLPFIEGAAQFALFFVILEKNYYGAHYRVVQADADSAEIHCQPLIELDVLQRAHFNPKLTRAEFIVLFQAIMAQRAQFCGLRADIGIEKQNCVIKLRKSGN